jgi:hypothetical protein
MQNSNLHFIKAQLPLASAISITTATATNVVSNSQTNVTSYIDGFTNASASATACFLNPGWWRVWGVLGFIAASTTTVTLLEGGINTTSATLPTGDLGLTSFSVTSFTTSSTSVIPIGAQIINVAANGTNLYLVGQCAFGTSTMTVYGTLYAEQIAS